MATIRATKKQCREIDNQLDRGDIPRLLAQAIVEGRVEISETPVSTALPLATELGLTLRQFGSTEEALRFWMQTVFNRIGLPFQVSVPPRLSSEQRTLLRNHGLQMVFIPSKSFPYIRGFETFNQTLAHQEHEECARVSTYPSGIHLYGNYRMGHSPDGWWAAVETHLKPAQDDPQVYLSDSLGREIGLSSRFGLSYGKVRGEHLPVIASTLGFEKACVHLPSVSEWNFIANLWRWLSLNFEDGLPDLTTNSYEWCWTSWQGKPSYLKGHFAMGCGDTTTAMGFRAGRYSQVGFRALVDVSHHAYLQSKSQGRRFPWFRKPRS